MTSSWPGRTPASRPENGTQWQQVPTPNIVRQDERLLGVSASGPNDAWAVGTTTAIQGVNVVRFTLAMHYNGTAWSIVKTVNTAEPTGLSGVTAISANNAWAVGNGFNNVHDTSASVANKAVIEHWNGTAWSIVASPAGLISVDRISAASATDIWASGQAPLQTIGGVPVPVARTLHWNGTAWYAMPGPAPPDRTPTRK